MKTIRSLYTLIIAFVASLFGRPAQAVVAVQQASATAQPADVRPVSAKEKRRTQLVRLLERVDGGGKHYGSKRVHSTHGRGPHRGKRSGRS